MKIVNNIQGCFVIGCKKIVDAKGLCHTHYERNRLHGDPYRVRQEWKTTKKAIKSSTLRDIEWAAGFCEGEASFEKIVGTVRLCQTKSREPLQKMLDLFGGTIQHVDRSTSRAKGVKGRDPEMWVICGARARGFMMTIYSLMSPKRQKQIRKALGK